MLLKTRHFGEVKINEKDIIRFENGIPGFEHNKKFIILSDDVQEASFKWLQSVDTPEVSFALVDPFIIKPDYDINISEETVEALNIKEKNDVEVYSIVVVPEDISKMTMNLKAPVIINVKDMKGIQVILDTDEYSVRHYILEELRKREVNNNACIDEEKRAVNSNR